MNRCRNPFAAPASKPGPSLRKAALALLVCFCCHSLAGHADPADQNQPVRIQADRVTLDERQAVSVYEGNVVVTQGTMRLNAETVRVFADRKRLDRIVAKGNLVEFFQKTAKGEEVRAQAREMEYRTQDQMVILLGSAKLTQGPNSFASERIEYNTVSAVVNAGDDTGRVDVIILPSDAREILDQ